MSIARKANPGRQDMQDEVVKEYIFSLPKDERQKSERGVLLIALMTPVGMDRENTVRELSDQVLRHIDGYRECVRKRNMSE